MRWHLITSALVVIVGFSTASHAEETTADSAESIIQDWGDAFNTNEAEKLLAFYEDSEQTEVFGSSGLRHQGYKAVEKAYRDAQKNVRFYDSAAKEIQVRTLGKTAIVTFEHRFKMQVLADDTRWQVHVRTTSVLHREEKKWKIVHEHSSSLRGVERITQIKD